MDIKIPYNINVRISNDTEIQELNRKHFGRDYPTDVLSFNLRDENDPPGDDYLGDIIVNIDQAMRQASEYGNDLEHELAALVEHGILHLLGVHHEGDDEYSVHGILKE